ncbi:Salicylate hydroxylase [Paraburkholderia caribensis MBA4]|uniref:Salicylate hydroxylase n=1 Tax=Paraburkholderia caribensis MBA4 TaxID=1323664 RepID=A0A0P0RGI1_9BURK|nr:NAD(P)/FAD-dependent oxidoreductase [Paraburkholderia caribensis]ALL67611.1 Salicylate hydroxylase [Paraburkholderia caribensis MBA4]
MKIAIIGAGLNGLACALMLKRNGFDCQVFERGSGPRDSGTGIYVWPQGVKVLRYLFGDDSFIRNGKAIEYLDTHDRDGKLVFSHPVRGPDRSLSDPAVMFPRSELFRLLLGQLGPDRVRYGMACTRLVHLDRQTHVTFNDSIEETFDLVIGCDGVGSTVRSLISPNHGPYDTGLVASRGMVHFDSPLLTNDRCQIFSTSFARVVTYPLAEGSRYRYWFAAYQHGNRMLLDREGLIDLFADLPSDIWSMIASTPDQDILTHRMMALTGDGEWSKGRVVMLGDSIHAMLPTLGYGLTLGLENGFALVQTLTGCKSENVDRALARYVSLAAERSKSILAVMKEITGLYYFNDSTAVNPTRLMPIMNRFNSLAALKVCEEVQ